MPTGATALEAADGGQSYGGGARAPDAVEPARRAPEQMMTDTPETGRPSAGHPNGSRADDAGSSHDGLSEDGPPDAEHTADLSDDGADPALTEEEQAAVRRTRRLQTAAAIGAILAIMIFMLIQGFLGAPDKIPGTG
ncbi:MAG: hypothetical protein WCA46_11540 [Actinocatenispora sp.]